MSPDSQVAQRVLKGALAVYEDDAPGTQPRLVVFQYNPETLKRTLASRTPPAPPGGGGNVGAAREDALRVLGPPTETITLNVAMHAADQLEFPDENREVAEHGLHPAIATLELLLYPRAEQTRDAQQQAQQGAVQLSPANTPLVLLVWGHERVVPVQLTGFSVSEELFDVNLNPISAKIDLSLKVLTTLDLPADSLGYNAYMSYHSRKEAVAAKDQPRGDDSRVRGLLPEM